MTATLAVAAAVARASTTELGNYLTRALGGRRRLVAAIVAALLVLIGGDLLVYRFLADSLSGVFDLAGSVPRAFSAAREVLVQAPGVTAAVFALILMMFFPAESALSVAARSAGARSAGIALGENLPIVWALLLITIGSSVGSLWFIASDQPVPLIVFVGLGGLVASDVLLALVVSQLFTAAARLCRMADAGARIIGMGAGFAIVTAALVDLISSAIGSRSNALSSLSDSLWGGRFLPLTVGDLLRTLLVAALLCGAYVGAVALAAPKGSLRSIPRLVVIPVIGRPALLVNLVAREVSMLLRHPVSQLGLLSAVALAAILVVGARLGVVPGGLAITATAILVSTGAETAYGRSLPWNWLARSIGLSPLRQLAGQLIGSLLIGLVLLTVGVIIIDSSGLFSTLVLPLALLQLVTFASVGYLSGVLLPYSSSAPLGIVLTSVVAVAVDAVTIWVSDQVDGVLTAAGVRDAEPPVEMAISLAISLLATMAALAVIRHQAIRIAQ